MSAAAKTKRSSLGRGLSSLLGEEGPRTEATMGDAALSSVAPTREVPIAFLHPSSYQPRRVFDEEAISDLVMSIRDKGVLQPILVRPHPAHQNEYEIIAGERRWRASQRAQLHQVPVIIRHFSNQEALEVALVENLQRQDLNPLEEADGYARLMKEFSHTQEDLAQAVGKSRSHVANMLRLLNLPDDVKDLVNTGALSAGHARALLGGDNPSALADVVVKKGLNVRQTEKLVKKGEHHPAASNAGAKRAAVLKDTDTLALEKDLSNMLGLKVSITAKGSGGDLSIAYETLEQLDDILNRLTRS
ncbi:MAG: chromosome partitioning protein ParB [Alphaproteobacteria bacterium RIFOXYD12_FULL_60_8]|nr:MAG: chromosome partitioning protein ParB [Alphaproteobacteria bacterium RIFOXYD12_FULL_60_8]